MTQPILLSKLLALPQWTFICLCMALLLLMPINATAENLDIEARQVFADEKKGITTATGNVKMVKGEDTLNADKVNLYVDKNRKPIKFEAMGNVDFYLLTQDGRRLKGNSDTLIYLIEANEYQLFGRAQVQEVGKPNFLKGEKIILNNNSGSANVESSSDAPVRVIIDLNDMQNNPNTPKKLESTSSQTNAPASHTTTP